MVQIYGSPRTSAGRCYLVLEEFGIPYEAVKIDMLEKREHKLPEYLRLNPNGKVPVLVDGESIIWESLAINYYLTEKYRPAWLGRTLLEKAHVQQWSTWSQVELQPPMIDIVIQMVFTPEPNRDMALVARAQASIPPKLAVLEAELNDKTYLVGPTCTLADLNVATVVNIAAALKISLDPYPSITAWLSRLKDRPAFKKWMEMRSSAG